VLLSGAEDLRLSPILAIRVALPGEKGALMRKPWSAAGVLVLLLCATACHSREPHFTGSRQGGVHGGSSLTTLHFAPGGESPSIALVHVLFVPQIDEPSDRMRGSATSVAGNLDVQELGYSYYEQDGPSIRAHPVFVKAAKTVEADGRIFQLAQGNLFIARVQREGSVALSQLPEVIQSMDASMDTVLAAMKAKAPDDARLQALR